MPSLKSIIYFFIFLILIHILATVYHWYWEIRWLDVVMHFLGGFAVVMVFFYFIKPKLQITDYNLLITFLLSIAFVAIVAIFWEYFEYFLDLFLKAIGVRKITIQDSFSLYIDTLTDLFFGLFGGVVFSITKLFFMKK